MVLTGSKLAPENPLYEKTILWEALRSAERASSNALVPALPKAGAVVQVYPATMLVTVSDNWAYESNVPLKAMRLGENPFPERETGWS